MNEQITIEVIGDRLRFPGGEIVRCWEDRSRWILSEVASHVVKAAADEDTAAYEAHYAAYTEDQEPPSPPEPRYLWLVDGEQAIVGELVDRGECYGIFIAEEGEIVGNMTMTPISVIMRLMEGK